MKAIIIYATKYGCTEKAVKLLQSKIPEETQAVNVAKEKAPELSSFDTVILGGPVYVGKMHGALAAYIRQNHEVLKRKKLALFMCAGEQDPAIIGKELTASFPKELRDHAMGWVVFGGELNWQKLDPMTKLVLRLVKGIKEGYSRLSEAKIDELAKLVVTS